MQLRVAVLGCGPAGLLAAHAATLSGADVKIFSQKVKSVIGGAQYLHIPVPELTQEEPDGEVLFMKSGDAATYARKVYGDEKAETSWEAFPAGFQNIWNMRAAYSSLWDRYEKLIIPTYLDPIVARGIWQEADLTLSAVPKLQLCSNREVHQFEYQAVEIDLEPSPRFPILEGSILYNGTVYEPWYRSSCIFEHASLEYPAGQGGSNCRKIRKPLNNSCDCWDGVAAFRMLGRYGRWEKKPLISDAYLGARDALL